MPDCPSLQWDLFLLVSANVIIGRVWSYKLKESSCEFEMSGCELQLAVDST